VEEMQARGLERGEYAFVGNERWDGVDTNQEEWYLSSKNRASINLQSLIDSLMMSGSLVTECTKKKCSDSFLGESGKR
jgi:hypothetical protein